MSIYGRGEETNQQAVLHIFHSSQTFSQNLQWDWRWLVPNLNFKKLKLTSEVMVAIHIPKSSKPHHYVTLFVLSVFWMLSKHKGCMSSWTHLWHWKTNSYWKHLHVSYGNWMTSSIFLKDLCLAFSCFYSWPWFWSPRFLCHIKLYEPKVQEGAQWFTGNRHFFVHNLNISYAWLPLYAHHCEKLPNSKLNKLMLTLLKKKLCQNCSIQWNQNRSQC